MKLYRLFQNKVFSSILENSAVFHKHLSYSLDILGSEEEVEFLECVAVKMKAL
jgi:hypothetical protein